MCFDCFNESRLEEVRGDFFLDLEDFKVGRAVNTVCGSSIWGSSDRLVEVHIYCMNTQHLSAEVSQMSQDLFII